MFKRLSKLKTSQTVFSVSLPPWSRSVQIKENKQIKMDKNEDVMCLIEDVVSYRKDVGNGIYKIHKEITNLLIKNIKNIKINLKNVDNQCEIFDDVIEKFKTESKEDYEYQNKLYDLMKILDILNSKISPIQKIIDEI